MLLKQLSAVLSACGVLLFVSTSAQAGVIASSQDFAAAVSSPTLAGTGKAGQKTTTTTSFNQFDASKGVLTGVNIATKTANASTQNVSLDVKYSGNTPNSSPASSVQSTLGLTAAGASKSATSTSSKASVICTHTVATSPSTKCGSNPAVSGATTATASNKASGGLPGDIAADVDNANLNDYVGAGKVDVTESLEVNATNSGVLSNATSTTKASATWNGTTTLSYTYLEHAAAGFGGIAGNTLDLDFGSFFVGDKVGSLGFSLANLFGDRVALSLIAIDQTGDTAHQFSTNLALFDDLSAGESTLFQADFLANTAGLHSVSYLLTFGDFAPDAASSSLYSGSTLTLNLHAAVLQPANQHIDVPEPASILLLGMGAAAFGLNRKRRQR
jgi:hypothetical protein